MIFKRFKENNKGSILALMMVVIGILAILGTATIGLAMSNFKSKMLSSVEKTNYYLAEAGLEEVYAKIYNIVSEAIDYANKEAIKEIEKYNDELFEDTVFLVENGDKKIGDSDIWFLSYEDGKYLYNEVAIKNRAEAIFVSSYQDKVKEKIVPGESSLIDLNGKISSGISGIDVSAILPDIDFNSNDILRIDLSSTYEANGIRKYAKVSLDIDTPKYNEPYTVYMENIEIPVNPLWTKAISNDGDLIISSPTEFNTELYSKGDIIVNNNAVFNRNIASLSDIEIASGVDIKLHDLYVRNINLNGSNINLTTNNSAQFYVKDDFLMNNDKQNVEINGDYYGFSDGSNSEDNTPDKSSAITINSDDINTGGSSLEITGNLNVTGTSYIAGVYQTGETISVKGNYVAYTSLLTKESTPEKYRNVIYDIIEGTHLMLVDTFEDGVTKLGVAHKNEFFNFYYLENKDTDSKGNLKLNNINVGGSIKTLGNIINSNSVEIGKGLGITEHNEEFKAMENRHSLMTKFLGDEDISHIDNKIDNINVVKDTIFTGSGLFKQIGGINYIYNTNPLNVITITLDESKVYYGFIVSNADVIINGKGTFSGSIISSKNVYINDSNKKTINYNESVVLRGLAKYPELFNAFKTYEMHKLKYYSTEIYGIDIPEGAVVNVDYSKLLKFTKWDISN